METNFSKRTLYFLLFNFIFSFGFIFYFYFLVVPKGEVGQGEAIPPFRHQSRRQFDGLTVGHILLQSLPSDYS